MAQDISERVETERDLHRIMFAVNSTPLEMYLFDYEGNIHYANQTAIDNLSLEKDASGKLFKKTQILPDIIPTIFDMVKKEGKVSLRTEHHTKEGKIYPVRVSTHYLRMEDVDYFLAITVDISESVAIESKLINARKEAEEANRAKGIFLANMSHEMKTPLNAILGFSRLLENHVTTEEGKDYLETSVEAGSALLRLISDVLDLSKIESSKLELMPRPVKLQDEIQKVLRMFSQKVSQKGLELKGNYNPEKGKPIMFSIGHFKQVVTNLIGNALKFTEKGAIVVSLEMQEHPDGKQCDIVCSVADTGVGIPLSSQTRIFEMFGQAEGQKSNVFDGTGLGLAISKNIIEAMGGDITLKSEVGKGSTFVIFVPNCEIVSEEKFSPEKKKKVEIPKFKQGKILVIDDIEFNRKVLSATLQGMGIDQVTEAKGGEEALELLETEHFDLILSDQRMPGMTGLELAKALQKVDRLKDTPFVIVTAANDLADTNGVMVDETIAREVVDFIIHKPVQMEPLTEVLRKFLGVEE